MALPEAKRSAPASCSIMKTHRPEPQSLWPSPPAKRRRQRPGRLRASTLRPAELRARLNSSCGGRGSAAQPIPGASLSGRCLRRTAALWPGRQAGGHFQPARAAPLRRRRRRRRAACARGRPGPAPAPPRPRPSSRPPPPKVAERGSCGSGGPAGVSGDCRGASARPQPPPSL